MSRRAAVRAVIFDWGGTITPWHRIDFEEQWSVFARHIHDDDSLAADLGRRILSAESTAWQRLRADGGSARLADILVEAGHDETHPAHATALAAYRTYWEPHTVSDPAVRPLWTGLKDRGLAVGLLSNTIWDRDYHRALLERDGVLDLLDGDVYSSEIHVAKPHADAFRAAAAAVDVAPEEAVYVGDRPFEDVYGAQRAGLRAIWIPHSDIPADQQVAIDVTPDAVAHELLDILDIVDGWLPEGAAEGTGPR